MNSAIECATTLFTITCITIRPLIEKLKYTIKTYFKTCLPRVNLRQLNLLICYIHLNEQTLVFIP